MSGDPSNPQPRTGGLWGRVSTLFLSAVIAVAVIGFFVGLADGVPQPDGIHHAPPVSPQDLAAAERDAKIIPAVSYAEISGTAMGPTAKWQAAAKVLPEQPYDLLAEVVPNPEDKLRSSETRASRRAFNGAPPVVPHPVQNTSDGACYACHSQGARLGELRASVMSHPFLANCLQCHAPPPPAPFQEQVHEVQTNFVGLPAPKAGNRAYPGAPPSIPHSRWMRENCNACHGGPNGWPGLETTHPWRTNCTQCHAPSAVLDQGISAVPVPMLVPSEVAGR